MTDLASSCAVSRMGPEHALLVSAGHVSYMAPLHSAILLSFRSCSRPEYHFGRYLSPSLTPSKAAIILPGPKG